ncbi:CotS family spore coat protein [Paenibacillus sp. LMG 31456]|uniref:CotS family spore coat protein n=1 Tax=Paenibacillus foliorum TaxID=2654974 RepID=A0A972GR32_9BACL|nr:CotS family spore coat protein [Paenibacillus foliorum]NOU94843.1 CotS family spore coat protein [Paenibacillus foliorum]
MVVENYQIVPWINDILSPEIVHEQYVPPEMEIMARQVMELYDMQVNEMILITSKPDKGGAIWKIGTNKGNRSIKVLHRRPARSLFSIGAQDYMANIGARVPSFIPTKDGNLCVEAGGKLWIVTEWIEPLIPVSKIDLEGAASLCFGLGEFHKNSKGYVPPFGSEVSSRLYGWPKYYEKIIAKISWFRDIANAYSDSPASASLLAVVDDFDRQASEILERFKQSPYSKMIAKGGAHWGLAHQDYGWSNGQMGPGGIWVIDLDGVSYDLPIRDLRKLMTSTMDDMGTWDITWIRGMIDAYHQANPIDQETFEILWLDMAFPNEFYKHVKEIVFEPVPFLQTELESILQRVMATETSKWQALTELEKDKSNYLVGDYTVEESEILYQFDRPDRSLQGDLLLPPQNDFWEKPFDADDAFTVQPDLVDANEDTPLTLQPDLVPAFEDMAPQFIQPDYLEKGMVVQIPVYSEAAVNTPFTPAPEIPQQAVVNQDPIPAALIQLPAPAPNKLTLRIPKRSSTKTKNSKKTGKTKRKNRKRLLKAKPRSNIKIVRKLKKPLLKKSVKPKKSTTKRLKGKGFKNVTHPLKKQNTSRQKTA